MTESSAVSTGGQQEESEFGFNNELNVAATTTNDNPSTEEPPALGDVRLYAVSQLLEQDNHVRIIIKAFFLSLFEVMLVHRGISAHVVWYVGAQLAR